MTVKLARPEDWITLSKLVKEVLPAWQALKQGVRSRCFTHVEQGTTVHVCTQSRQQRDSARSHFSHLLLYSSNTAAVHGRNLLRLHGTWLVTYEGQVCNQCTALHCVAMKSTQHPLYQGCLTHAQPNLATKHTLIIRIAVCMCVCMCMRLAGRQAAASRWQCCWTAATGCVQAPH